MITKPSRVPTDEELAQIRDAYEKIYGKEAGEVFDEVPQLITIFDDVSGYKVALWLDKVVDYQFALYHCPMDGSVWRVVIESDEHKLFYYTKEKGVDA